MTKFITNPRLNSRAWKLKMMERGDRLLFEAAAGKGQKTMQQIAADLTRLNLVGMTNMSIAIGVEYSTRKLFDIVIVERL